MIRKFFLEEVKTIKEKIEILLKYNDDEIRKRILKNFDFIFNKVLKENNLKSEEEIFKDDVLLNSIKDEIEKEFENLTNSIKSEVQKVTSSYSIKRDYVGNVLYFKDIILILFLLEGKDNNIKRSFFEDLDIIINIITRLFDLGNSAKNLSVLREILKDNINVKYRDLVNELGIYNKYTNEITFRYIDPFEVALHNRDLTTAFSNISKIIDDVFSSKKEVVSVKDKKPVNKVEGWLFNLLGDKYNNLSEDIKELYGDFTAYPENLKYNLKHFKDLYSNLKYEEVLDNSNFRILYLKTRESINIMGIYWSYKQAIREIEELAGSKFKMYDSNYLDGNTNMCSWCVNNTEHYNGYGRNYIIFFDKKNKMKYLLVSNPKNGRFDIRPQSDNAMPLSFWEKVFKDNLTDSDKEKVLEYIAKMEIENMGENFEQFMAS